MGKAYLSAWVTMFGWPYPLVRGTGIVLVFSDDGDRFTGTAGCGTLNGSVQVAGDRLLIELQTPPERACDTLHTAQDAWVRAFLSADPTFTLQGPLLQLQAGWTVVALLDEDSYTLPPP